jgi:site-specific recombinase XerD
MHLVDAQLMKQSSMLGNLLSEIGNVESLQQALVLYKRLGMGEKSVSPRTRVEYENDLADLITFLATSGVNQPTQVGLAHLRIYQADLERRGYKASTCNRKTFAIKGFFSFLYEYALIKDNIAKELIPPQVERGEPRFLSEAEYTQLLQVCQGNPRDAAIIELFLQTGIRLSELVGLTVPDVTLPATITSDTGFTGSIRIKRGSGHATIPLNYKASNALRKWLEVRVSVAGDKVLKIAE